MIETEEQKTLSLAYASIQNYQREMRELLDVLMPEGSSNHAERLEAVRELVRERDALRVEVEELKLRQREIDLATSLNKKLYAGLEKWTGNFQPGGVFEGVLACGENISEVGGVWLVEQVLKLRKELATERYEVEILMINISHLHNDLETEKARIRFLKRKLEDSRVEVARLRKQQEAQP